MERLANEHSLHLIKILNWPRACKYINLKNASNSHRLAVWREGG